MRLILATVTPEAIAASFVVKFSIPASIGHLKQDHHKSSPRGERLKQWESSPCAPDREGTILGLISSDRVNPASSRMLPAWRLGLSPRNSVARSRCHSLLGRPTSSNA